MYVCMWVEVFKGVLAKGITYGLFEGQLFQRLGCEWQMDDKS